MFNVRTVIVLISLALAGAANAQPACLAGDRGVGATFGSAEFFGEPWTHTWENGSQTTVPAAGLKIIIGDAEVLQQVKKDGGAADSLTTLHRGLGDGPFTAVKLRDGSVIIVNDECQESWPLIQKQPTNPVALDGTVVVAEEMECLAKMGILTFAEMAVDVNGVLLDDPIRQTGGWAMSWGPGTYVAGVNTWGDKWSFNVTDGTCAASSVSE